MLRCTCKSSSAAAPCSRAVSSCVRGSSSVSSAAFPQLVPVAAQCPLDPPATGAFAVAQLQQQCLPSPTDHPWVGIASTKRLQTACWGSSSPCSAPRLPFSLLGVPVLPFGMAGSARKVPALDGLGRSPLAHQRVVHGKVCCKEPASWSGHSSPNPGHWLGAASSRLPRWSWGLDR